jgi:hypothetical protein
VHGHGTRQPDPQPHHEHATPYGSLQRGQRLAIKVLIAGLFNSLKENHL